MSGEAPDVAGVIVGWRTWNIAREEPDPDPVLLSRVTWRPGEPIEASHHGSIFSAWAGEVEREHEAPQMNCTCGIYAVPQATDLVGQLGAAQGPMLLTGRAVAGKVALWGRVIEHRSGWRAQYAKPLALALPPEPSRTLLDVQERYGLPSVDDEGLFAAHDRRGDAVMDNLRATQSRVEAKMVRFGEEMRRAAESAQRGASAGAMLRAAITSEHRQRPRPKVKGATADRVIVDEGTP